MFSTDALTWHLAFRHHLRPESCESETGFSHVAWVKVGFNIAGGQLRSLKKAVPYKKDLLENRSQAFCGLRCKSKSSFGYDSAAGYIDSAPTLVRIDSILPCGTSPHTALARAFLGYILGFVCAHASLGPWERRPLSSRFTP